MGVSHESSRPLMSPSLISYKDALRFGSGSDSNALTRTPSSSSTDSAQLEISEIEAVLRKLQNKQLSTQRFIATEEKKEYLNKLAFGAKLERALQHRMIEQDAEMRIQLVEEDFLNEKEE